MSACKPACVSSSLALSLGLGAPQKKEIPPCSPQSCPLLYKEPLTSARRTRAGGRRRVRWGPGVVLLAGAERGGFLVGEAVLRARRAERKTERKLVKSGKTRWKEREGVTERTARAERGPQLMIALPCSLGCPVPAAGQQTSPSELLAMGACVILAPREILIWFDPQWTFQCCPFMLTSRAVGRFQGAVEAQEE